jgi:hypothetical protein
MSTLTSPAKAMSGGGVKAFFKMFKERPEEAKPHEGIEKALGGPSLSTSNGSAIGARP